LDWLEFTLLVPTPQVEIAAEVLGRHCPGGVSIEQPILPTDGGEGYALDPEKAATVRAYLPSHTDTDQRRRALRRELTSVGLASMLRTRWRREEEWAEAWKRFFGVERIGRRLVVCPTWIDYAPREGEVLIQIDPGMAFGTGQHPTTRLCLEALEARLRPGHTVLDVGTGSGILAVAAALLGAARVVALDIDPVAVAAARQNVALNGLEGRVRVLEASLTAGGPLDDDDGSRFDLVLANISSAGIAEMAPDLVRALAPGGVLMASGISEGSLEPCRDALVQAGLCVVERMDREGWCALVCAPA